MSRTLRSVARLLGLTTLLLTLTSGAIGDPPPAVAPPKADCAFSNQYYSGWCRVTIPQPTDMTPEQACAVVLSCLNGNNSSCEGNVNPCHAPDIRSGWRLEEARRSQPQPTPTR
jgi:hypothetical protein